MIPELEGSKTIPNRLDLILKRRVFSFPSSAKCFKLFQSWQLQLHKFTYRNTNLSNWDYAETLRPVQTYMFVSGYLVHVMSFVHMWTIFTCVNFVSFSLRLSKVKTLKKESYRRLRNDSTRQALMNTDVTSSSNCACSMLVSYPVFLVWYRFQGVWPGRVF